jgi:nitrite reductase/ring-hydroxylating ferredoxin subunit
LDVSQRLASLDELRKRGTIKFTFREEGISREGFLAWFEGQVVCYENVCRHVPITLDYGDGQFFTPDRAHFICQTHGATYEPLTGKCIAGPCPGAHLKRLPIALEGSEIFLLTEHLNPRP